MATVVKAPAKKRLNNGTALNGASGLRLFTASEYQRLADTGVLGEDERIELIEGRIVQMAPKNVSHAIATKRANRCLASLLGDRLIIGVQDPILLNDYSEPEPDIVLVAPPDEHYLVHHPKPKDIFLVLEIAESSLAYDRDVKGPLYASNGIIQYCLLNLNDRELEDYRHPGRDGYRSKQTYSENQSFSLVAFPEVSIRVSDLLPPVKSTVKQRRK
ncbi:MAG TPA: Uma2 family endonuclease [Blastocatellia bacterium]|nr:Uma2 family endonuclease [Blastocatellia bacterium]